MHKIILLLTLLSVCQCVGFADQPYRISTPPESNSAQIELSLVQGHGVCVHWAVPGKFTAVHLLRTVSPIDEKMLHRERYPVVKLLDSWRPEGTFIDDQAADRTTAYYWVEVERGAGQPREYATDEIRIPNTPLTGQLTGLNLLVDKSQYYVALRQGRKTLKRYPIALGAHPVRCKFYQDHGSTPEGIYHVVGRQPRASFYKALDIDYPTARDRARFQVVSSLGYIPAGSSIGGDIELHGDVKRNEEIFSNWTWGCIALRNADIDELFAQRNIGPGLQVAIVGNTFTPADERQQASGPVQRGKRELRAVTGRSDMRAIAIYQHQRGLPLSCEVDQRTLAALDTEISTASR